VIAQFQVSVLASPARDLGGYLRFSPPAFEAGWVMRASSSSMRCSRLRISWLASSSCFDPLRVPHVQLQQLDSSGAQVPQVPFRAFHDAVVGEDLLDSKIRLSFMNAGASTSTHLGGLKASQ
jgi:hypothetical protein